MRTTVADRITITTSSLNIPDGSKEMPTPFPNNRVRAASDHAQATSGAETDSLWANNPAPENSLQEIIQHSQESCTQNSLNRWTIYTSYASWTYRDYWQTHLRFDPSAS